MNEAPAPVTGSGQGRVIAGVAAGVVALALLGFGVGWLAFHGGTPSVSTTPTVAPPATPVGSLNPEALADYRGLDFTAVRADLRSRRLGVRLFFGTGPENPAVERTDPPAGTRVRAGMTIKVYVTGAAPLLSLPSVVGQQCGSGGKALAEAGVYPYYPTGRNGLVVSTDPATTATTVHWNDTVKVFCAPPGTSPSPVPSASSSSPDPDASPPPEPSGSASATETPLP
jgi:hypothetical protein